MAKKRKKGGRKKRTGNPAKAAGGGSAAATASDSGGGERSASKSSQRGAARRRTAPTPPKRKRFRVKRWEGVVLGIVGLAVLFGAWTWWSSRDDTDAFNLLVAAGRGSLSGIETFPDAGSNHLAGGQRFRYPSQFPTSGPHDPNLLSPGFYDQPQRSERLVHSLEHGMIVMYYDDPGGDAIGTMRGWTSQFRGPWSGVIAVKRPGLGREVVLSAWQRNFRLDPFDPAAAAAFLDLFRGRGPENAVR